MPHPQAVSALKALLTEKLKLDAKCCPLALGMEGSSVVMEGMVERVAHKKRALLLAMGLDGVDGVVDRLRVRPASRMSDAEIRDHLTAAFSQEGALQGIGITAEVSGGVVDIEGEAPSLSHKRLAGVLAWWVPGVTDVINSIEVVPPEQDTDAEITDAVRLVLEKDRLVDAQSLTVACRDYVVTLGGVAGSEAEKDAAEDDAWFTWGVNDVVNNIAVDENSVHKLP